MDVKVEELEDGSIRVTSPKFKKPFEIFKTFDGHAMYTIKYTQGLTAPHLKGWYTSSTMALQALKTYILQSKDSPTVVKEQKKNEPVRKPNNKKHLRKGPAD